MPPKKKHWYLLGEINGVWAWISCNGESLVWRKDGPNSPPTSGAADWSVSQIMEPDFDGWLPDDYEETRERIRRWRSKHKSWAELVARVRTYQEKQNR